MQFEKIIGWGRSVQTHGGGDIYVTATSASFFPIRASSNGRYLVSGSSQPYLMLAISLQPLIIETASNAQSVINTYAGLGFNAAQIDCICNNGVINTPPAQPAAGAQTRDGVNAFINGGTGLGGFSASTTPVSTYWNRLDTLVSYCAQKNMMCILNPYQPNNDLPGGASTTDCENYGKFVGTRYSTFSNVSYQFGSDYITSSALDPYVAAIIKGVQETSPVGTLISMETFYGSPGGTAFDSATLNSYLNWQGSYTYDLPYVNNMISYNSTGVTFTATAAYHGTNFTPPAPSTLLEAAYEWEQNGPGADEPGNATTIRMQSYWCMLYGLCGINHGNGWVSTSLITSTAGNGNIQVGGYAAGGWTANANLNTTAVAHLNIMQTFLTSIPWYNLKPDQGHVIGTAGYGTPSGVGTPFHNNTFITVAADSLTGGAHYAVAYFQFTWTGTLTVDLSKFAGAVTAQWFDPTTGVYTSAGAGPTFVPTGNNAAGDPDWVLLLTA